MKIGQAGVGHHRLETSAIESLGEAEPDGKQAVRKDRARDRRGDMTVDCATRLQSSVQGHIMLQQPVRLG